jgi:hypothetical protein
MHVRVWWFPIVIAALCLIRSDTAICSSQIPVELIGTWDCMTMTALKNGTPFGRIDFRPGDWSMSFNQDATWTMKVQVPNPHSMNGSYSTHGHDLDLKLANGATYEKYRFTVEHDGKTLTLANLEVTISANRD